MNIKVVAWGLAWAGTEARPTKKELTAGTARPMKPIFQKPETGNHPGMPALRTPL